MAPFILARLAFGPKRLPAFVMKTPSSSTRTSTEPTFKTLSAMPLLQARGPLQDTGPCGRVGNSGENQPHPTLYFAAHPKATIYFSLKAFLTALPSARGCLRSV